MSRRRHRLGKLQRGFELSDAAVDTMARKRLCTAASWAGRCGNRQRRQTRRASSGRVKSTVPLRAQLWSLRALATGFCKPPPSRQKYLD